MSPRNAWYWCFYCISNLLCSASRKVFSKSKLKRLFEINEKTWSSALFSFMKPHWYSLLVFYVLNISFLNGKYFIGCIKECKAPIKLTLRMIYFLINTTEYCYGIFFSFAFKCCLLVFVFGQMILFSSQTWIFLLLFPGISFFGKFAIVWYVVCCENFWKLIFHDENLFFFVFDWLFLPRHLLFHSFLVHEDL